MVLPRDIKGSERPRQWTGNAALRSEGGGPVLKDWKPRYGRLVMVSVRVATLGDTVLPWMQVAGSSVLISPLQTCDIVAALCQGPLAM